MSRDVGMARLFSSEKARRQGAIRPCENPSARGDYYTPDAEDARNPKLRPKPQS